MSKMQKDIEDIFSWSFIHEIDSIVTGVLAGVVYLNASYLSSLFKLETGTGNTCGYKDEEMECRWYQLGIFSPIMRLHSTKNEFNGKEPWRYLRDIEEIMKELLRLRHKLIPYLYTMNYRAYHDDEALIQPLYYKHDWRNVFDQVRNEYYYGTDFLVSPITKKQFPGIHAAGVSTWIPKGTWIDFFTGLIYQSEERTMDLYR